MKLKTKIQLFSSLFILLIVVLVNTSIYFLFYKITTDNEVEQLAGQTNAIVETLKDAHPDISKSELLHAFLPAHGIIRIVDVDGKELIPTITKNPEYRNITLEFSNKETQGITSGDSGAKVAVISKPIIWDDGQIVTLQVGNYLLPMEETMRTLLYVLIFASLMIIIPTVIAGNLLSKFILAPITKLMVTMKENTKQGKWQTIDVNDRSHDEIYEMETTYNEMINQLKDNFEKQEVFVSDASHELKTPIAIIKSYAQLLERRGKSHPEVFNEAVEAIDSESDRMQQLVEQMLLLAKNKEAAPHETIELVSLIEKIMVTFKKAYDREMKFSYEVSSAEIMGNVDQIEQVIYILLDNAIKYSEGDIHVMLFVQTNVVQIKVMDKGEGMPPEDEQLIFNRFYRVDKSRARASGGTGLGLSIAKTITELHGGTISVKSIQGEGSTFTIELPLE